MKSAGINFGLPNTEYILKTNDAGEATSCYNQDTDTEYIGGGGGGDLEYSTWEIVINCPAISEESINILSVNKYVDDHEIVFEAPIVNNSICTFLGIELTEALTDFTQKIAVFGTVSPEDQPLEIQMNELTGYTASTTGNITFESIPDSGWIFFVTGSGTITITVG